MSQKEIFYTWNSVSPERLGDVKVDALKFDCVFDETLRDGIQAPTVRNPPLEAKKKIVDYMVRSGVRHADLGFPGANETALNECVQLVEHIKENSHELKPAFAGRTTTSDISAISRVAELTQMNIEAYGFVAISPIRRYVQGWDISEIQSSIKTSSKECREGGSEFVLVLEDAFRCPPETLKEIYDVALESCPSRICLCDTVGAALPEGTKALIQWTAGYLQDQNGGIPLEWHGHNDRGMAVANSLAALDAGCSRVHGTILGVGERAGNAALDQLIVNLYSTTDLPENLKPLVDYADFAQEELAVNLPYNYPALGRDVFKTSAGVHAAAILKAHKSGNSILKDMVYSSVVASQLGREQEVLIDEVAGANNVEYWFLSQGRTDFTKEKSEAILREAKSRKGFLSDEEIRNVIDSSI